METLAHSYMKLCLFGKLRISYAYMKLNTYWENCLCFQKFCLEMRLFLLRISSVV